MIFNLPTGFPARPIFDVTVDGTTYNFIGQSEITVADKFYIQIKETHAWRMYVYPGVQLTVAMKSFNPSRTVDIGIVGKGGNGGSGGFYGNAACGGGGGGGGEVKTILNQSFQPGETYTFNTNESTSVVGGLLNLTCNNGGNGQSGSGNPVARGGASGGNSGSGGSGAYSTGYHGGGSGGSGVLLFDSTFDSTLYGAGGGGGPAYDTGGGSNGEGYGNPGSGGKGHTAGSYFPDSGRNGWNGIIWIKSSDW